MRLKYGTNSKQIRNNIWTFRCILVTNYAAACIHTHSQWVCHEANETRRKKERAAKREWSNIVKWKRPMLSLERTLHNFFLMLLLLLLAWILARLSRSHFIVLLPSPSVTHSCFSLICRFVLRYISRAQTYSSQTIKKVNHTKLFGTHT